MGERYPYKVDVVGSIPTSCTIMSRYPSGLRASAATRLFVSSNLTLLSNNMVGIVQWQNAGLWLRLCKFDSYY